MGKDGKREKFLVFGAPDIRRAEIDEVVHSLESGWLGTGPKVARFENAFAAYKGVDPVRVAALFSCTAALHLSMVAVGLEPGDEVVTTPLTFCATANAIIHAGGVPVLADVEPESMNIDPRAMAAAVTPRTRALMPVHFAGRPCDMDPITALAEHKELVLIEDCAHAVETLYKGRQAGTFGDFGCFSFYVTKNVACGEGGMVLAKSPALAERIKVLALHGMSQDAWRRFSDAGYRHYLVTECGFKYNMMDLQAAIGIHQLERVEANHERRAKIWSIYRERLADLPLGLPAEPEAGTRHAFHLYTIRVNEGDAGMSRDDFLEAMTRERIGVGVHYLSLPEHPYYQERFGWRPEDFPNAMRIGRETVSLPLSPALSEADVDAVVNAVRRVLGFPPD